MYPVVAPYGSDVYNAPNQMVQDPESYISNNGRKVNNSLASPEFSYLNVPMPSYGSGVVER
jgi:hypothetical protein